MPLKDVGNGIQQFVPEAGGDALEGVQKTLSLVDLANRVQSAPLEESLRKADLQLKASQIAQIPIELESKRIENILKQNQEFRTQAQFRMNTMKELPALFASNFEMGAEVAKSLGLQAFKNQDGTVGILAPGQDKKSAFKTYTIDPNNIADPEKKLNAETTFRKEWEGISKDYGIISKAYRNMEKLANDGSGTSDIAILYNYIKLLDPNSVVREGEVSLSQQGVNVPNWVVQKYKQAFETKAPVLAASVRSDMLNSGKTIYSTAREDIIGYGKNLGEIVLNSKLRPQNVITRTGDLTYKDILGGAQSLAEDNAPGVTSPASTTVAPKQSRPSPQEAGAIQTGQTQAPKVPLSQALNDFKQRLIKPQGVKKNAP